jgi:hypothetical protein
VTAVVVVPLEDDVGSFAHGRMLRDR